MSDLPWLQAGELQFPNPCLALTEPNGLLALGGDLSVERLLLAYSQGIFPWYSKEPILWWSPDPRAVLRFEDFHVSHSLRKTLNKSHFSVTFNQCFEQVLEGCSQERAHQSGTWIIPEMKAAYLELHQVGAAESVEVFKGGQLVGGLYGVVIGHAFFAESMFSRQSNASKAALFFLIERLRERGFTWLDCQILSPHLETLGAIEIPRTTYLSWLQAALTQ